MVRWRDITGGSVARIARTNPALAQTFMQTDHRVFTSRGLIVKISTDDGRRHLSISHARRYPTWNEIRDARYDLLPDVPCMAMILPPREDYVNLHPNCFHLWEIDQPDQTKDGLHMQPTGAAR